MRRHARHGAHLAIQLPHARRKPPHRREPPRTSILGITRRYEHKLFMQLTPPEDKRLIGTCPSCERDLWCTDTEIAGQWIVCECGQTLKVRDVQEQHLLMCALADNKGSKGTAADIARLLHANGIEVKRWTISKWKERGLLHPVGFQDGKPVYRVWDVWQCLTRADE
jgi:hypothetical protein